MMNSYHRESTALRKRVNLFLLLVGLGFIVSAGILGDRYIEVNRNGFEAKMWPVTTDWTFRDWQQSDSGHWSAKVFFYKLRPECIYVKDQIPTITFLTPSGVIGESGIRFIGDKTPGNSRPGGWQRIDDRVEFTSTVIEKGTVLRGNFLHQCHEGLPIITGFQDVVVGSETPWPDYVEKWVRNNRKGTPSDYR